MNEFTSVARSVDGAGVRMLIGAVIWLLGVFLTWSAFVAGGLPSDPNTDAGQWVIIAAFTSQAAISAMSLRVFRGERDAVGMFVLGVDVLINYAGTVQYTSPLSKYLFAEIGSLWFLNFSEILQWGFPFLVAFLIAYTPERLWNSR